MQIYSDLNEFIEAFSVFNDLTLNSLRVSFAALLLSGIVALVLFVCRCWIFLKQSKKSRPSSSVKVSYYGRNMRRYMGRSDFHENFY